MNKFLITMISVCVIALISLTTYADQRLGDHPHVVMNPNNDDDEEKFFGNECTPSVNPEAIGGARGSMTCRKLMPYNPWDRSFPGNLQINVTSDTDGWQNIECNMFPSNDNNGNNQGYNTTQYTSNADANNADDGYWVMDGKLTPVDVPWEHPNTDQYYNMLLSVECYGGIEAN